MHSPEKNNSSREKWWSYDTPYDIVRRRELAMHGETQRVQDIDDYISYINEDMDNGYKISTRLDERTDRVLAYNKSNGTRVYKVNESGIYEPLCHISMVGVFYGNKIMLDDEDPVVINSEVGLGVSPAEYVRFVSPYVLDSQYGATNKYREQNFERIVRQLLRLKRGDKKYIRDFDSPWY